MRNTLSIVKYIFTAVGLTLLGLSMWKYSATKTFIESAVTTDGEVVDFTRGSGTNYKPVVRFKTKDGEEIEYVSSLSTNPPLFDRGEVVTIFYKPDDPQNAKIDEFWSLWFFSVLTGGMGTIFFAIGGGMVLFVNLREKRAEKLRREGTRIQAKFIGVELNKMIRVNNRSPYRITCQWQDPVSSNLHIFRSKNLWFDPTDYIKTETLTVFIGRNNPKKYYVDVSFLPKISK